MKRRRRRGPPSWPVWVWPNHPQEPKSPKKKKKNRIVAATSVNVAIKKGKILWCFSDHSSKVEGILGGAIENE
jgi:hypothetical protein